MADYVELLGPPGVGKSTIYRILRTRWTRRDAWITDRDLLSRAVLQAPTFLERMEWAARRVTSRPQVKAMKKAGMSFLLEKPALARACWELITRCRAVEEGGVDHRFLVADYFLWSFQRIGAVVGAPDSRLCVVDEGLYHRISSSLSFSEDFTIKDIESTVDLVPRPAGVVHLIASAGEIVVRNRMRTAAPEFHRGLDSQQLSRRTEDVQRWLKVLLSRLGEAGVDVLEVDIGGDSHLACDAIISFLNGVIDKKDAGMSALVRGSE